MADSEDHSLQDDQYQALRADYTALRQMYDCLMQALDLAPIYFYLLDQDSRTILLNRQFAAFYDRPIEDMLGRTLAEMHANRPEANKIIANVRSVIESGEPRVWRNYEITDPDGRQYVADLHDIPFVDADTGEKRLLGIGIDITEHKELERRKLEQARIDQDLLIARQIQRNLLPGEPPALEGLDLAGWSEAADHTGGDYFDWMPLPDGRVVTSIADVSGHGVGPAIVTAVCRAYARAIFHGDQPLCDLITRLNNLLCHDLPPDRFVTFAAAVIDPRTCVVDIVSAGHGPILFYHAATDRIHTRPADGAPLGVLRDQSFDQTQHIEFQPGDTLVLVSDGFFEWPDESGEHFGLDRLTQAVADASQPSARFAAKDIIEYLRQAVYTHVGPVKQTDDMTAVVIKRSTV